MGFPEANEMSFGGSEQPPPYTPSSTATPHPPPSVVPLLPLEKVDNVRSTFGRGGACSSRVGTMLLYFGTGRRGRRPLQINVQYISCRGGVSPPARQRCYFAFTPSHRFAELPQRGSQYNVSKLPYLFPITSYFLPQKKHLLSQVLLVYRFIRST